MTKKLARPTACTFRKLDARTDAEGAPIRTYEVRSGDLILGTVCGDSDGTWYAEAGLGGSAEPLSTEGKAMRFPTRSHAAEVLRAFVVGRSEHLAEKAEKLGKVLAGSTWWHHAEPAPKTLAELREAIIAEKIHPMDLVKLPTFGGTEPESTHGVFSWDATHILTQDRTGWAIVERTDPPPAQVEVSLGQRSGSPEFRASQADVEEAVRVLVASMVPTAKVQVSSRNDDGADRVSVDGDSSCALAREIKDCLADADWEAERDAEPQGRKYIHAVGSDGCLTVCGADMDDSAVAADQLHAFGGNACPACLALCVETHRVAFPNGCGDSWATMCPDCCDRIGARAVPKVHLGPDRWDTVCGSPSENWSANPASVTCPDCMADEVKMAAGKVNYASQALAQMLWRLVDAATLIARLVPKADVGLQTLTGRGGLLVVAEVSAPKLVATPAAVIEAIRREAAKVGPSLDHDQATRVTMVVEASCGRKPSADEWAAAGFEWVGSDHVLGGRAQPRTK